MEALLWVVLCVGIGSWFLGFGSRWVEGKVNKLVEVAAGKDVKTGVR